jgi:hypothetical protein
MNKLFFTTFIFHKFFAPFPQHQHVKVYTISMVHVTGSKLDVKTK